MKHVRSARKANNMTSLWRRILSFILLTRSHLKIRDDDDDNSSRAASLCSFSTSWAIDKRLSLCELVCALNKTVHYKSNIELVTYSAHNSCSTWKRRIYLFTPHTFSAVFFQSTRNKNITWSNMSISAAQKNPSQNPRNADLKFLIENKVSYLLGKILHKLASKYTHQTLWERYFSSNKFLAVDRNSRD